jgi:hypothetical protein
LTQSGELSWLCFHTESTLIEGSQKLLTNLA